MFRRFAAPLLGTLLASCLAATPAPTSTRLLGPTIFPSLASSGPSPAAPAAATPSPMLAPPGSVLFTSPDGDPAGNQVPDITISALLPNGTVDIIATLPGIRDGFADRRDLYPPIPLLCPVLVSDTFFVAVAFESVDRIGLSRLVLYDLRHPDAGPVAQLETPTSPCEYRWGPDGRLALDRYNEALRLVMDTTTLVPRAVAVDPRDQIVRRLWTRDGRGWQAWRQLDGAADSGIVSATTGEYTPTPNVPPAWLNSGGEPMSADGLMFWSADADPSPSCGQLSTGSLSGDQSTRSVWWDTCRDRGLIWHRQWGIDGRGLLVLVEDGGHWTLERWPTPGERQVLARFSLPPVRELEVHAAAPGPTADQVQIVFHTLGDGGAGLYVVRSARDEAIPLFRQAQNVGGFAGIAPIAP